MKKLFMFLFALLLVVFFSGEAQATTRAQRSGRYPVVQTAVGGTVSVDTVISGNSELITGISITSTATAAIVGIYNGTGTGDITDANNLWEGGAPANESVYYAFDPPIQATTGVVIGVSNASGVTTYLEREFR